MVGLALKCRCGARGDVGELVEHCVSKLDAPDDEGDHGWGAEPEQVKAARQGWQRRQQTRKTIADQLGISVAELREAMR